MCHFLVILDPLNTPQKAILGVPKVVILVKTAQITFWGFGPPNVKTPISEISSPSLIGFLDPLGVIMPNTPFGRNDPFRPIMTIGVKMPLSSPLDVGFLGHRSVILVILVILTIWSLLTIWVILTIIAVLGI